MPAKTGGIAKYFGYFLLVFGFVCFVGSLVGAYYQDLNINKFKEGSALRLSYTIGIYGIYLLLSTLLMSVGVFLAKVRGLFYVVLCCLFLEIGAVIFAYHYEQQNRAITKENLQNLNNALEQYFSK